MDVEQIQRTVLVGVDGSQSALRAVRWGAAEAGRRGVPLRLVKAFGWAADEAVDQAWYREVLLERARAVLEEAAQVAAGEALDIAVEQQVVVGSAISVLVEESRRALIVVLGDRGLTRLEGLLVGSVAVALAAQAFCPFVVVRGSEGEPGEASSLPVVVGVDGSAMSEVAVAFAFETAAARGVSLVAVHAWSDLTFAPEVALVVDWGSIEAVEQQRLSDRLAGWASKYPEVPIEKVLVRGRPAHALLERSAGAQLVVVGSRGRGDFAGLVLGSVSNALLHRAECPVGVARLPAAEGQE